MARDTRRREIREREREIFHNGRRRKRQTETNRETDRQRERETETERERQTDRQTDTERQTEMFFLMGERLCSHLKTTMCRGGGGGGLRSPQDTGNK